MSRHIYIFSCTLIAVSLAYLIPTVQLPGAEEVSTFIGPRLWPLVLLILLLVLTVSLMITTLVQDRKRKDAQEPGDIEENDSSHEGYEDHAVPSNGLLSLLFTYRHWIVLVLTVIYTVMIQIIGFLVATVMFSFLCTMLLGARGKVAIVSTTVIATMLVQVGFVYLLNIPLP